MHRSLLQHSVCDFMDMLYHSGLWLHPVGSWSSSFIQNRLSKNSCRQKLEISKELKVKQLGRRVRLSNVCMPIMMLYLHAMSCTHSRTGCHTPGDRAEKVTVPWTLAHALRLVCCSGSADALREEVMQSSWYEAFRSDMRSNVVVRAVEGSVGGIGWATQAATSWTSTQLAFTGQGLRLASSH